MSDFYDTPPDPDEMAKVMEAMVKAWQSGNDYIAESQRSYFRYAVPIMNHFEGTRLSYKTEYADAPDGKRYVIDTYKVPNGKELRIGYELQD